MNFNHPGQGFFFTVFLFETAFRRGLPDSSATNVWREGFRGTGVFLGAGGMILQKYSFQLCIQNKNTNVPDRHT
jgi:hypothetical protein